MTKVKSAGNYWPSRRRLNPVSRYGFFVVVELEEEATRWNFAYLVTAKHTADVIKGSPFYIRVNLRNGTAEDVEMNRQGQPIVWYTHPTDPDADVAVVPVTIPEEVDTLCLPSSMIIGEAKREELRIGIGDEVFMIGLFAHLKGKTKNVPISRVGNIAMFPEERKGLLQKIPLASLE